MVLGAALLGFAWLPTSLAASPLTTSSTNSTGSLPPSAFLQGYTSTPLPSPTATGTPTPQPTATPTAVPISTLQPNSVATLSPLGISSNTPGVSSSTITPFIASLAATPTTSIAASPVPLDSSTSSSTSPQTGPQGLPPSAIFVPGGSVALSASAPASSPAGPIDLVVDATVGGTLALPDNSLRLVIPAGVADTDSLLVSISEVAPSSASGNLEVGTRLFAVTLVDSGGASITNFGTPVLLTAMSTTSTGRSSANSTASLVSALDPDSGQFSPLATVPQSGGQVAGSLDKLAAPTSTGVPPDPSPSIAQANSRQVAPPPSAGDATQILDNLGLAP
jgi:hypothetical protein